MNHFFGRKGYTDEGYYRVKDRIELKSMEHINAFLCFFFALHINLIFISYFFLLFFLAIRTKINFNPWHFGSVPGAARFFLTFSF